MNDGIDTAAAVMAVRLTRLMQVNGASDTKKESNKYGRSLDFKARSRLRESAIRTNIPKNEAVLGYLSYGVRPGQ